MKKAKIFIVTRGRNVGQFRFVLYAANGEPVAQSHPETYHRKGMAVKTLKRLFPDFVIVDKIFVKGIKKKLLIK